MQRLCEPGAADKGPRGALAALAAATRDRQRLGCSWSLQVSTTAGRRTAVPSAKLRRDRRRLRLRRRHAVAAAGAVGDLSRWGMRRLARGCGAGGDAVGRSGRRRVRRRRLVRLLKGSLLHAVAPPKAALQAAEPVGCGAGISKQGNI